MKQAVMIALMILFPIVLLAQKKPPTPEKGWVTGGHVGGLHIHFDEEEDRYALVLTRNVSAEFLLYCNNREEPCDKQRGHLGQFDLKKRNGLWLIVAVVKRDRAQGGGYRAFGAWYVKYDGHLAVKLWSGEDANAWQLLYERLPYPES